MRPGGAMDARRIDFRRPDFAFDWGERFDAAVKDVMTRRPAEL